MQPEPSQEESMRSSPSSSSSLPSLPPLPPLPAPTDDFDLYMLLPHPRVISPHVPVGKRAAPTDTSSESREQWVKVFSAATGGELLRRLIYRIKDARYNAYALLRMLLSSLFGGWTNAYDVRLHAVRTRMPSNMGPSEDNLYIFQPEGKWAVDDGLCQRLLTDDFSQVFWVPFHLEKAPCPPLYKHFRAPKPGSRLSESSSYGSARRQPLLPIRPSNLTRVRQPTTPPTSTNPTTPPMEPRTPPRLSERAKQPVEVEMQVEHTIDTEPDDGGEWRDRSTRWCAKDVALAMTAISCQTMKRPASDFINQLAKHVTESMQSVRILDDDALHRQIVNREGGDDVARDVVNEESLYVSFSQNTLLLPRRGDIGYAKGFLAWMPLPNAGWIDRNTIRPPIQRWEGQPFYQGAYFPLADDVFRIELVCSEAFDRMDLDVIPTVATRPADDVGPEWHQFGPRGAFLAAAAMLRILARDNVVDTDLYRWLCIYSGENWSKAGDVVVASISDRVERWRQQVFR